MEKFINGLPTLFSQKVKETLCSPLGVIDYDNLTYGDISSTIRSEGMKMCRDLKIQSHINKNKAKYEIEHFCTQYGLPSVKPSKENPRNPFHKHPANATTVERKVISRVSVEPRPSPLSTPSLVTNPAKMRSSSY